MNIFTRKVLRKKFEKTYRRAEAVKSKMNKIPMDKEHTKELIHYHKTYYHLLCWCETYLRMLYPNEGAE